MSTRLSFTLPPALAATEPPEARGRSRDAVRLMVAHRSTGGVEHSAFAHLPSHLRPGDLVVVNTSATIPAAVDATGADGCRFVVHLSTHLAGDVWGLEARQPDGAATRRWPVDDGPPPRDAILLPDGRMHLLDRHLGSARLWTARLHLPDPPLLWLARHGRPIRYGYVRRPWPAGAYQNVYATEPGSAEMPSAGRPFTTGILTRLMATGVGVVPVVLHTGVSSLEAEEVPYPERYRVPAATAVAVNATRAAGGRIVAVGTTVVRALETVAGEDGHVEPGAGWTDLVVTPERGVRSVDGLLTGWHEPEASHLLLLETVAGRPLLEASYAAAVQERYRWHEFGDVHLILP